MKRILHVVSSFHYGGTEAFFVNIHNNVNKENIKFELYIADKPESDSISQEYIRQIESNGIKVYYGLDFSSKIKFMVSLYRHIKSKGTYQAVHSHVNIANSWVLFTAYLAGVKTRISHSHATCGKEKTNFLRTLYLYFLTKVLNIFSTEKLACSEYAGNYLYGKNIFSKHGETINNGIEIKKFQNIDEKLINKIRGMYDIDNDDFIIGNITRFEIRKNYSFILDVFVEVLKIKPNSTLILGGSDGGEFNNIKEKVTRLNIGKNVRFVGPRTDINVFLALMDAYILPSFTEGLPIVALESQAARLPMFLSDTISQELDIGAGLVYFLSLSKGPKYWAKYITDNYKFDKPDYDVLNEKFRRSGFSVERAARTLEKIYESNNNSQ